MFAWLGGVLAVVKGGLDVGLFFLMNMGKLKHAKVILQSFEALDASDINDLNAAWTRVRVIWAQQRSIK